ncbi:MAG: diguanylate cyclase, partial [Leptospiraceae bacterium]|nr:diguanylate cyclase [Leptospiraceae bacterium]
MERRRLAMLASMREKNRRIMNLVLATALLGVPLISAVDILANHTKSTAIEVILVAASQTIVVLAVGLIRLLDRRTYERHATMLLSILLTAIVLPQIHDVLVTDQSRFELFGASFLGMVFFLRIPRARAALLNFSISCFAMYMFLDYGQIPATTIIPTLTGIALIGIVRQHQWERAFDTDFQLHQRSVRLRNQTILYRRALSAFEESEARYHSVVDAMVEGVLIIAPDRIVLTCNRSASSILGLSEESIIGSCVDELPLNPLAEDGCSVSFFDLAPLGLGASRVHLSDRTISVATTDGNRKWIRLNARPLLRSDGQSAYAVAVTISDITEQKNQADIIRHQAFHDSLTGLANRSLLHESLNLELAHANRDNSNLAVLFIDLDGFKNVNDSLGHSAGDALLVEISRRLRTCVRKSDTLARTGGDEFVVILPRLNSSLDAETVAQKILQSIELPISLGQEVVSVSASIGISVFPENGRDAENLLQSADAAMYAAKRAGRHSIRFFSPAMNEKSNIRLTMAHELREAISVDALTLAFQPRIDLHTSSVDGVEALVRWNSKNGPVSPATFIPVAEETGLILPLGDRVLDMAMETRKRLSREHPQIRVAVNFSSSQFALPNLAERIRIATREKGILPACLEIEVTEG